MLSESDKKRNRLKPIKQKNEFKRILSLGSWPTKKRYLWGVKFVSIIIPGNSNYLHVEHGLRWSFSC